MRVAIAGGPEVLTSRTRDLLEEVDVRLVDHIVVFRIETVSMAARGLI